MLLSCVGTVIGILISGWSVDLILTLSPIQLPSFVSIALDRNVILFATALAAFTAIVMPLAPALHFSPGNIGEALKGIPKPRTTTTINENPIFFRRVRAA
jgi:hypothetical protein